jgi:hypothetical protein
MNTPAPKNRNPSMTPRRHNCELFKNGSNNCVYFMKTISAIKTPQVVSSGK